MPVSCFWPVKRFGNAFPAIHGLRFLAVLLVIQVHVLVMNPTTADALRANHPFVALFATNVNYVMDFFFVLSGFLISHIFLKSGIRGWTDFRDFYIRRSF